MGCTETGDGPSLAGLWFAGPCGRAAQRWPCALCPWVQGLDLQEVDHLLLMGVDHPRPPLLRAGLWCGAAFSSTDRVVSVERSPEIYHTHTHTHTRARARAHPNF